MDLIVCGDALWISCGTWVSLWNGAIGAFVGAIVGGLTALLVVRLTNAQQRRQAEHSREILAAADFVTECTSFRARYKSEGSFDAMEQYSKLESAVVRMRLSGPNMAPIAEAIKDWPSTLPSLASAYGVALRQNSSMSEEISHTVGTAASAVIVCLSGWATASGQAAALAVLEKQTRALEECLASARQELRQPHANTNVDQMGAEAEGAHP